MKLIPLTMMLSMITATKRIQKPANRNFRVSVGGVSRIWASKVRFVLPV